jgi:hypothetical protein
LKVSEKEMKEAADSSALGERWAPTSSRSTAAVFFAGVSFSSAMAGGYHH